MKQNITDREIISIFQRYLASNDPSEINQIKVEDLVAAEARLRIQGINPNFTEVIKSKIRHLELNEARKYESRIRAWNLITGFIIGLAIAGIASWLF